LPTLAQDEFDVTEGPTKIQGDNAKYTCFETQTGQATMITALCGVMPDWMYDMNGNRYRYTCDGAPTRPSDAWPCAWNFVPDGRGTG